MERALIESLVEALVRSDGATVRAVLEQRAQDPRTEMPEAVLCEAMTEEYEAAAGSPTLLGMALRGLARDDEIEAQTLAPVQEIALISLPDPATLATRWIAAYAQDRAAARADRRPPVRYSAGFASQAARDAPRSFRTDPRVEAASESALALSNELTGILALLPPVGVPLVAALQCNWWSVGQFGMWWYFASLDVARRMFQRSENPALAARLLLLLLIERRRRGVTSETLDWASLVQRLVPGDSRTANAATALLALARGERVRETAWALAKHPWHADRLRALESATTALHHEDDLDAESVESLRVVGMRLADKLDANGAARCVALLRRAPLRADARALAQIEEHILRARSLCGCVDRLGAEGTSKVASAAAETMADALEALAQRAPAAKMTFASFGLGGRPSGIGTLLPEDRWRPVSRLPNGDVLQFEYCLAGQSLDDWQALLEISSFPETADFSAAELVSNSEAHWRAALIDGELDALSFDGPPPDRGLPAGDTLGTYVLRVAGDSLFGHRLELHEFWRLAGRICRLRLTLRRFAEPLPSADEALIAIGKLRSVLLAPQALDTQSLISRATAVNNAINALTQRLQQEVLPEAPQQFVAAFQGLHQALSLSGCAQWNVDAAAALADATFDPAHLRIGAAPAAALLRRLEWSPTDSPAQALALEQWIIARLAQEGASLLARVVFAVLERAATVYAAHGLHRGALRCLQRLNLELPERLVEPQQAAILERLMAIRETMVEAPRLWAHADIEMLRIVAKRCWGLPENAALRLGERLRDEAMQLADRIELAWLRDEAMLAFRLISLTHDPLCTFWQRGLKEVLAGGPLCNYSYRPRADAVFLRPFDSAEIRLPHRLAEPVWKKLAAASSSSCDATTITLEGALAACTGMDLSSVGGNQSSLGASRVIIDDASWKSAVRIYLRRAAQWNAAKQRPGRCRVVFLVPSSTAGVLWEMKALRRFGLLNQTLFVMPPRTAQPDAAAVWEAARPLWRAATGLEFPRHVDNGGLFAFEAPPQVRGAPHLIAFDELWNNGLARTLEEKLAERFGRGFWSEWTVDDVLASTRAQGR